MGWVMGNEHPCLVVGIPSLEPTARPPKQGFPKKKDFPTSDFQVQAILVSGRVYIWGTFLLPSTIIDGFQFTASPTSLAGLHMILKWY